MYRYNCFGKTYEVEIRQGWYAGDRLALELADRYGECVSKVTVNIPEVELEDGEILVKTWSENEPMTQFLLDNGLAADTGKRVPCGAHGAEAWIMKLTDKGKREG